MKMLFFEFDDNFLGTRSLLWCESLSGQAENHSFLGIWRSRFSDLQKKEKQHCDSKIIAEPCMANSFEFLAAFEYL